VSNNRAERALFEIFFYIVKMVELRSGCYFSPILWFAAGTICFGVPFRVKRGLGKQIFLIEA
jgi:hypothetical protein